MQKKGLLFTIFCFVFLYVPVFYSCMSSGHFAPAGEDSVLMQNEAIEAFSAAKKYESNKQYAAAISCYEKAMQYDTLRDTSYYRMGRCYALMGEWKKAEDVFASILAKDAANSSIKDSLGYVYVQSGKYEQAESVYESLSAEHPFNAEYSYKYIKALFQNGKKSEALAAFTAFKNTFPRNSEEIKTLTRLLTEQPDNSDISAD